MFNVAKGTIQLEHYNFISKLMASSENKKHILYYNTDKIRMTIIY